MRLILALAAVAIVAAIDAPATADVPGTCGNLPLPSALEGKQVVLAVPANKHEPQPCAAGTVVAYTLVDGSQLFLPAPASQPSSQPSAAAPAATTSANYPALELPDLMAKADAGDAAAQYELGSRYSSGSIGQQHLPTNQEQAQSLMWIDRAAAQGYSHARLIRAIGSLSGTLGRKKNCKLAIGELDALFGAGFVPALRWRGYAAQFGFCVRQDYALARQLYNQTIERGDSVERETAIAWLKIMGNKGLPTGGSGGGFLDVVAQAAPVLIGAVNDATTQIAADRQAAAAQQAAADRQRQVAMAAGQARQRQASVASAAVTAARSGGATPAPAILQRQQAALAQAGVASSTSAGAQRPTARTRAAPPAAITTGHHRYNSVAAMGGGWLNSGYVAGAYRVQGTRVVRGVASGAEEAGFVMVDGLRFERTQVTEGGASHYFTGTCRQAFPMPAGVEVREFPGCMVRVYEGHPYDGSATVSSDYSGFTGSRRGD